MCRGSQRGRRLHARVRAARVLRRYRDPACTPPPPSAQGSALAWLRRVAVVCGAPHRRVCASVRCRSAPRRPTAFSAPLPPQKMSCRVARTPSFFSEDARSVMWSAQKTWCSPGVLMRSPPSESTTITERRRPRKNLCGIPRVKLSIFCPFSWRRTQTRRSSEKSVIRHV